MSTTYSDLNFTQYPDSCDTYEYMSDLSLETLELATQYQSLINSNKFTEAAQLLIDNPNLNKIVFNAEKYNKLIDSIKAIERLYFSDIQTYIIELVKYKGTYSSSQKYTKYDVVEYNSMIYMCISLSVPLGTLPTDNSYWYPLSIKGDQGESGTGLSPRGVWDSEIQYYKDDLVSYNNQLWAAKEDNISSLPNNDSSIWYSVLYSDVTKDYVDTKYNELFQSVSNGKITVANAITDKGVETNSTDTFATIAENISLIETGIHTTDATATENQILENYTAYVNDNKITGTMTDFSLASNGDDVVSSIYNDQPIVNTVGSAAVQYGTWGTNGDKEGLIVAPKQGYYPNTSDATTSYMYVPADTVATKLKINPYKIVKGYTIAGIQGAADTSGGITNFNLTISTTQPSPIDVGHIWVNTSRVSNPRCYIVPYVLSSIANNSIAFVVGDYSTMYYWGQNSTNGFTTEFYNQGSSRGWRAGYKSGSFETWLPTPKIYSKVNDVIYMETAYMWNGSYWVNISNADKYFIAGSNTEGLGVFNIINEQLVRKSVGLESFSNRYMSVSDNGQFMALAASSSPAENQLNIFKRTGDTFTYMQAITLTNLNSITGYQIFISGGLSAFSADGRYMVLVCQSYNHYGYDSTFLIRYKLNDTQTAFDYLGHQVISSHYITTTGTHLNYPAVGSSDLSVVCAVITDGNYNYPIICIGSAESGYTIHYKESGLGYLSDTTSCFAISDNGKYAILSNTSRSNVYVINQVNNTYIYTLNTVYYSFRNYVTQIRNDGRFIMSTASTSQAAIISHGYINDDSTSSVVIQNTISASTVSGVSLLTNYTVLGISYSDTNEIYVAITTDSSSIGQSSSSSKIILVKANLDSSGWISSFTFKNEVSAQGISAYQGAFIGI